MKQVYFSDMQAVDINSKSLYVTFSKIVDYLFSFKCEIGSPQECLQIKRPEECRLYCQTSQGFFLKVYKNVPMFILTPWGEVQVMQYCPELTPEVLEKILKGLGAVQVKGLSVCADTKVYEINCVGERTLCEPLMYNRSFGYDERKPAQTFRALRDGYRAQKSVQSLHQQNRKLVLA